MQKALNDIKQELSGLYPESEIQSLFYIILEFVCKKDKHSLLRGKDNEISSNERVKIHEIIKELKIFRPIQHILGETEFFGLSFLVNKEVLIPRPETEELVDLILNSVDSKKSLSILDIGTGSGCIAISLAKHLPNAQIYALDISEKALEMARQNAIKNEVTIRFIEEDILTVKKDSPIHKIGWDIIVSNPPYIIPSEKKQMSANVLSYEPEQALFVPENESLLFYEKIADFGLKQLKESGFLFFETSSLFGKSTAEMIKTKGYSSVELYKDISQNDRMIKAIL